MGQFSKNYGPFYPKTCPYALKSMGLGSGIRDSGSGKKLFRIPDPGSRGQKGTGSRIPDPDPQHCLQDWDPSYFSKVQRNFRTKFTILTYLMFSTLGHNDVRYRVGSGAKLIIRIRNSELRIRGSGSQRNIQGLQILRTVGIHPVPIMRASQNRSLMMETTKLTSLFRSMDRLACAWSSITLHK